MFKQRLLSGIVLVAVILVLFVLGNDVLLIGMLLISAIGMSELLRVFGIDARWDPLAWIAYLSIAFYYGNMGGRLGNAKHVTVDEMFIVSVFLLALLAAYVLRYPRYHADQIMAAFFSFFYVGVMLSYIWQLRMLPTGAYLVWLVILCSWGSDTCAYCVGVLFGKHKMAPVLSPKKSVEGAIGGVVGAMLLTAIYGMVFSRPLHVLPRDVILLSVVAGVGALISMIGDLAASAIKRNYDIKDYGTLIPGHGGILDRFDSVIITAPIVYYLCAYFVVR